MLIYDRCKLVSEFIVASTWFTLHGVPPRLTQGDWHEISIPYTWRKVFDDISGENGSVTGFRGKAWGRHSQFYFSNFKGSTTSYTVHSRLSRKKQQKSKGVYKGGYKFARNRDQAWSQTSRRTLHN